MHIVRRQRQRAELILDSNASLALPFPFILNASHKPDSSSLDLFQVHPQRHLFPDDKAPLHMYPVGLHAARGEFEIEVPQQSRQNEAHFRVCQTATTDEMRLTMQSIQTKAAGSQTSEVCRLTSCLCNSWVRSRTAETRLSCHFETDSVKVCRRSCHLTLAASVRG